MKLLVLGRSGQLASHLRELWPDAAFRGRDQLDLSQPAAIEAAVLEHRPDAIVNAAAYTAVDRAEAEPALAWSINALAPAALARAAGRLRIPLVHVSTDYVFDGARTEQYEEDAATAPLNAYGRSKLAGERAIVVHCPTHWILRASWIFSEYGANFVKTMLRLARESKPLAVVDDQFGRPTHAAAVAACIDWLLRDGIPRGAVPPGIHHLGRGPSVSWHEFAEVSLREATLAGLLASEPEVRRVTTAEFSSSRSGPVAVRPERAVLRPSASLQGFHGDVDWRDSLRACMRRLAVLEAQA